MDDTIEQLHYTWTPRGVEGLNRFQIAAMSSGLRSGPASGAMPVVRRVCRYDRPRGQRGRLPASYGWLDHRDLRIAFSRVPLPPMRGKAGNFAAHVLVGPPAALPAARLAAAFGAPWWWSGPTEEELDEIKAGWRDLALPAFDPALLVAPVPAGPLDSGALRRASVLGAALFGLAPTRRLSVAVHGDDLGHALRSIASVVPEALDGLSVSTYEGRSTFPFRVTGTTSPTADTVDLATSELDDLDGRAMERLLTVARLREACRPRAGRDADQRRAAYWKTATSLVALVTDPDAGEVALLANPLAAGFLATEDLGRARLAAAMQSSPIVREAVVEAMATARDSDRRRLADALLHSYSHSHHLGGCAVAVSLIGDPSKRDRLIAAAACTAATSSAAAASLESPDAELLVAHGTAAGVGAPERTRLLAATAMHVGTCAHNPLVTDADIALMLHHHLQGNGARASFAEALRVRPRALAAAKLDSAARGRGLRLLDRLDQRGLVDALPAAAAALDDPDSVGRLRVLAQRLEPLTAADALIQATRLRPPSPALTELCMDMAATVLQSRSNVSPSTRWRTLSCASQLAAAGGAGTEAARILRALQGHAAHPLTLAGQTHHITHDGLRAALAATALAAAVARTRQWSDVADVWRTILDLYPDIADSDALRVLLTHAAAEGESRPNAIVLAWVAHDLLPARPRLVTVTGRLRDREAGRAADAAAAKVSRGDVDRLAPLMAGAARPGIGWWNRVVAQRHAHARFDDT